MKKKKLFLIMDFNLIKILEAVLYPLLKMKLLLLQ